MEYDQVVSARRSIRKYRQESVPEELIRQILDYARLAPSAGNGQHLRYIVVQNSAAAEKLFAQTAWAGHVKPRRTPVWGEDAPRCFIAVTADSSFNSQLAAADAGAAIENMLLGMANCGLGGCWIGSFNREKCVELLKLDSSETLYYLVSVGYPAEAPVAEDVSAGSDLRYYLDDDDVLHVPKLDVPSLTRWM